MTTPQQQQFGPLAGEEGSPERYQWDIRWAQVVDAQSMNSKTVHEMMAQGIGGTDGVVLMARLNALIDMLFGDLSGNPGMFSHTGLPIQRLDVELSLQRVVSTALATARQAAEQALQAAGRPARTSSGIILPGRNGNPTN